MRKMSFLAALMLAALPLSGAGPAKAPARFTDLDLVGYWHREPYSWDAERLAPHVSWKAPDGGEYWLFNAFLFLEGSDWLHHKNLCISPSGMSAGKAEWEFQLELWLGAEGGVAGLEQACRETAARIGNPPSKRQVVIGLPDAIMFENFADKTSSTTYWGDGLDFASVEGRLTALKWYIDEARSRFAALGCKYLELAGFYITSEDLHLPWDVDVNSRYKNWDEIVPALSAYCHKAGEGLYWIPYNMAPGHKYWQQLGIDQAWMQPNWYWDHRAGEKHPFGRTMAAIKENGMGMELEFEYSAVAEQMAPGVKGPDSFGKLTFTSDDVPALKDRLRRYMKEYRDAGLLGNGSIALYSGSNALTQLASSSQSRDKALYDELCRFVLENRGALQKAQVQVDAEGRLQTLSVDGRNYAGGRALWRLYYNTPEQKEIELRGEDYVPEISHSSDTTILNYSGLDGKKFFLRLKIWPEGRVVRFAAALRNEEPHTIVRELQYPLIGSLSLPKGYKLLTTHTGGQIFDDPVAKIANVDTRALYMTPAQKFRQYDLQYPRNAASNCFAFVGTEDGLYFGSHDYSLQQTYHGLRAYPAAPQPADYPLHPQGTEGRSPQTPPAAARQPDTAEQQAALAADANIQNSQLTNKAASAAASERQRDSEGIEAAEMPAGTQWKRHAPGGSRKATGDKKTRASASAAASERQRDSKGIEAAEMPAGTQWKRHVPGGSREATGDKEFGKVIGLVTGDFTELEAGFYRYPNAMCGDSWSNDASVVVPYKGDWTGTSRIYRRWADTWWHHAEVPKWVQDMTGWQRIIFKHQYGEYLHHYADLPGHIAQVGESVGCNATLAFGWWKEGMDNGYPNYTVDDSQGGDAAWKQAIKEYRSKGNRLLLYYNGRLIDVESNFYRSGGGSRVANKDNTGREFTEHYKFTGEGTTLGYYDSRTFVIADMSKREWRDQLLAWADRAMDYGSDAVFYDQLGVAEEFPNWDLSREYPVQDIFTGRYKAEALQEIRDHIKARNPEFALGTEWLSDCTSRFCDFVHIVEFTALPESFPEWFRYTFPEVIWSDRCVRDDNDVPRRVGNTLLKGLRNDIEVFRCRGLIDQTPVYQAYLAQVNAIRHEFPELLLEGRYTATDGVICSSPAITARSYSADGKTAVVAVNAGEKTACGRISVPGSKLTAVRTIGDASASGGRVRLGQYGLAVMVFEKEQ